VFTTMPNQPGKSALLLVNPIKPAARAAADTVRTLIERHGRLVEEIPADNGPIPASARGAEIIVVLGGDGTLISQSRRFRQYGAPMLGVNLGRLGFLAEFDLDALAAQAPLIFGHAPLQTREFNLLNVEVFGAQEKSAHFSGTALNEVVITAGPPYRMISLAISIDGVPGPTISGDGVIICTSLGSTAYNLSAGGPILSPPVDAFAITPIAAHSLSVRPLVIPGNSRIDVSAVRVNQAKAGSDGVTIGTTLVLDGQVHTPILAGDRICITGNGKSVPFVQNAASSYWSRLIGKLNWAAPPKLSEQD
jgi:NAD+ kinase